MSERGGELVATDEPTIVSKPLLDAIVVEDSQGDRCFPDPPWSDESDRSEISCKANNLLDQLVTSKTSPQWQGRQFSRRDTIQI